MYEDDTEPRTADGPVGRRAFLRAAGGLTMALAAAEVVLLGYPIWWGGASWVLDDFVRGNDFTGKVVYPFCTSASSPLGSSADDLAELAGTGDWQEGVRFAIGADETSVAEWLIGISGLEG